MTEQEKKRQRTYDLLNAETKPKCFCFVYGRQKLFLLYTKQRKFLQKKTFLRKRGGCGGLNKKRKEGFLTALVTEIKDPITSIRNYAN